jgi:hypothetical protein
MDDAECAEIAQPVEHPAGHFYSPIVNTTEVISRAGDLWPARPEVLGIDFNDASHETILSEYFPRHIGKYDYPDSVSDDDAPTRFYTGNSQFSWLDSRALMVLLCEWQPRRIIEVGSGYSSLLMADVNERFLGRNCDITCVEPYPRPFLRRPPAGITRLVEQKVQDVPLEVFETLGAGDILFIDSSHVAKTGSDVNRLYFDVLPRLRPGVRIHIHDIFLPNEYPQEWVIEYNRSWNEQYLLRALLMYSVGFRVVFGCSYAFYRFPELVGRALALPNGDAFAGGSFWIERLVTG